MISVQLSSRDVSWCVTEGDSTRALFADRPGPYRTSNSPLNHMIAKLGEAAVEQWLMGITPAVEVRALFRDINRIDRCDIHAPRCDLRIEVKCWNSHTWDRGGRCVSPGQASAVLAKADAIVWCRLAQRVDEAVLRRGCPLQVEIMGWSTPQDVMNQPLIDTSFTKVVRLNHQVPAEAMQSIDTLLARLRGAP